MGFCDRRTINDYAEYPEFSDTIKRALLFIEARKTSALVNGRGSTTGLILDLKNNYGWKDEIDVDQKQETIIRIDKIFEKA